MTELEKKLHNKLPERCFRIDLEKGFLIYYDYHGVAFVETEAEDRAVKAYITDMASRLAGYPVRIVEWSSGNNGHFADRFERIDKE